MSLGFCPRCKEKVILKRSDLDICLLIILTIFTAGIGTIIYLVIYYSTEPKRCLKCNNLCVPLSLQDQQEPLNVDVEKCNLETISHKTVNYCPDCGTKLGNLSNEPNFCPFCGCNLKLRKKSEMKPLDCAVCHQKVDENQNSIKCAFCGTIFHYNCVSNWLLQHNTCPLCLNCFVIPEKSQS